MNLLAVFRVLGLLLVLRFLMRFLRFVVQGYRGPAPRAAAQPGQLVRDRICNTFLPRERAIRAIVDGHEEHFAPRLPRPGPAPAAGPLTVA
jgi:hypothetical protein